MSDVIIDTEELFEPGPYDHEHGVQRYVCLLCDDHVVDKGDHLVLNHYAHQTVTR